MPHYLIDVTVMCKKIYTERKSIDRKPNCASENNTQRDLQTPQY